MPAWKKLITSGSDAYLNSLNVATSVTASYFTGSLVGIGSGSFSGSFEGDGFGLTGVVSSSYAVTASYVDFDNIGNIPNGLLSSSAQIADEISGSFTNISSSFAGDITNLISDSGSFSVRVTNLESFSASLNDTYATDLELTIATASLSSSIAILSSSFEVF
jgi:hypothetical protein